MNRNRLIYILPVMLTLLLVMTGCISNTEENEEIDVMTTLFPHYDLTKQIAKDKVNVTLMLPPGVESHSYQPSPKQMVALYNSDLFIYTGDFMEVWVHDALDSRDAKNVTVVDASEHINLHDHGVEHAHEEENHDDEHAHEEDNHDDEHGHEDEDHTSEEHTDDNHINVDPHYWLDPLNAKIMVDTILDGLISIDPDNEAFYRQNAEAYKNELDGLHHNFEEAINNSQHNTIVYAGHFAFGYFAERYHLEHKSPYKNFSPSTPPSTSQITSLIDFINTSGQTHIFFEENVDPTVANKIAEETNTDKLLLHGLHNISRDEIQSGETYVSLMEQNIEKLKIGLGYDETE